MAGTTAASAIVDEMVGRVVELGPDVVPLAVAALTARCSREAMLRALLCGRVVGGQMRGKWFCNRTSLRAFVRRNARNDPAT